MSNALATVEIGHKLNCVFDGGELISSETIYTDGAATFALNGDGTLTWEDCKEAPGEEKICRSVGVPAGKLLLSGVNKERENFSDIMDRCGLQKYMLHR